MAVLLFLTVMSLVCVLLKSNNGRTLVINVYMPTDSSDDYSYAEYVGMTLCTKIIAVFTEVAFVAAVDFNSRSDSRFSNISIISWFKKTG